MRGSHHCKRCERWISSRVQDVPPNGTKYPRCYWGLLRGIGTTRHLFLANADNHAVCGAKG